MNKEEYKKELHEMTVEEIKKITKKEGLKVTKESGRKKMNKTELIEQLVESFVEKVECENEDNGSWGDDIGEESTTTVEEEKRQEPVIVEVEAEEIIPKFAKTLEEIELKYHRRKKDSVYDDELKVGSFVVYFMDVTAKDGNTYRKLRTAKVVGVNRSKELVKIQTLFGDFLTLEFNDLLYIRKDEQQCTYPYDIVCYLRKQRMESRERYSKENEVRNNERAEEINQ